MKTYNGWNESKLDFGEYANPGDEIDDDIYYYFLGVLPPRKMAHYGFLVGEPYSHNSDGAAVYDSFYQSPDGKRFYYGGRKTVREFTDPNSPRYNL